MTVTDPVEAIHQSCSACSMCGCKRRREHAANAAKHEHRWTGESSQCFGSRQALLTFFLCMRACLHERMQPQAPEPQPCLDSHGLEAISFPVSTGCSCEQLDSSYSCKQRIHSLPTSSRLIVLANISSPCATIYNSCWH